MTNEQSNKIILLLLGVLLLLVFMDLQAGRHFRKMSGLEPAEGATPILSAIQSGFELEPVGSPETDDSVPEHSTPDSTGTQAGQAPPGLSPVDSEYENNPFPEGITVNPRQMYLYFFRFKGKTTELVRVKRVHDGSPISLKDVVQALREGPAPGERGLLSAFDERVHVLRVGVADHLAYVDVDESIQRNGKRIIQDRLDQLTLTLTQFPEVDGVRLYLKGSPVTTLGDEKLPIAEIMTPPNRKIVGYN